MNEQPGHISEQERQFRSEMARSLRAARQYGLTQKDTEAKALSETVSLLSKSMRAPDNGDLVASFTTASQRAVHRWTLPWIFEVAAVRFARQTNGVAARKKLNKQGAVAQIVWGDLVPVETLNANHQDPLPVFEMINKTDPVLQALQTINVASNDLMVTYSQPSPSPFRRLPYTLITIPKFGRQIAVCNQKGQPTFISDQILPLHVWAKSDQSELKTMSGVLTVQDDIQAQWIKELLSAVTKGIDHFDQVRKVRLPSRSFQALITESQIADWMQHTHDYWLEIAHENAGRWPTFSDVEVYTRHPQTGKFQRVPGENWHALNMALTRGGRGLPENSSLSKIKDDNGFNHLTEQTIASWMQDTHDYWILTHHPKAGRWPRKEDGYEVYRRNPETGDFEHLKWEHWGSIDAALADKRRGLPEKSSLAVIRQRHQWVDAKKEEKLLSEQEIASWMQDTHDYWLKIAHANAGRWPNQMDGYEVYKRNPETGDFQRLPENWGALNMALQRGNRGLPGGSSLVVLRDQILQASSPYCDLRLRKSKRRPVSSPA